MSPRGEGIGVMGRWEVVRGELGVYLGRWYGLETVGKGWYGFG
ncbi:hypothetical protein Tco_0571927, partial [Tanacetum coccineum]